MHITLGRTAVEYRRPTMPFTAEGVIVGATRPTTEVGPHYDIRLPDGRIEPNVSQDRITKVL